MYISSFHFISPCFVTSIFQNFWSFSSCFRVFPIYLIRFICYKTEMGLYKKKMYVPLFHFVSPCFVTIFEQVFKKKKKKKKKMYVSSFHFISPCFLRNKHISNILVCFIMSQSFFLYILFVLFVTKQKWVYKKKDVCFIVSFHFTRFRNDL